MIRAFPHIHFLQFMVLFIPTVFYSYVADEISYFFIILAAGIYSVLKKKRYEANQKNYIRFFAGAILLATFQALIFEVDGRFYLTSAEECYPFVLFIGLMFSFFKEHPKYNMSILIISAFAMMFCGDIIFDLNFPNLGIARDYGRVSFIRSLYVLFLLAYFPFFVTLLRKSLPQRELKVGNYRHYKQRFFIITLAIVIVVLLVVPLRNLVLPFMKKGDRFLADKILSMYHNSHRFSKKSDLRRNFDDYDADDDAVLISVESDSAPGYLRAQVFTTYKEGVWEESKAGGKMLDPSEDDSSIYHLVGKSEQEAIHSMEISYHDMMEKKYLLHRGNTQSLKLNANYLFQSSDGILKVTGFQGDVELFEYETPLLAGQISQKDMEGYLSVPSAIAAQLSRYQEIVFGQNWRSQEAQELMGSVVKYFKGYTYEFGVNLEEGIDPAIAFLEGKERRGHCEYFANTTALLLRSVGVPTRYVTGFFCVEKHPYEDKYIGRGHDLHAWVEAYDNKTRRWLVVESTPSAGIPNSRSDSTVLASFFDAIKEAFNSIVRAFKDGEVRDLILSLLKLFAVFIIFLLKSVYGWIIIAVVIAWRVRKYLSRDKGNSKTLIAKSFDEQRSRIDKAIEKHLHVHNLESFTVRELLALKEISENPKLCESLQKYEQILYSKCEQDLESIKQLGQDILKELKTLKTSVG